MLKNFFQPKSVAVIGASREPGKLGYRILNNIVQSGYQGKVYPVNPKAEEILGLKSYPDISCLPETPDLAVIVIPAGLVLEAVRQYGEKGGQAVIVISAGFKEAGEEGKSREKMLVEICSRYKLRMIGPNCLGVIDTSSKLNASFAFDLPRKGNIAFISQSGALGTAVLDWSLKEGIGLSKFISVGNMADVSEADLLQVLADDPETRVVLLYLEGIKDGCRFLKIAREVTLKKPVIVVKAGRTSAGLKAVSSHTGSLAGSDAAFQAAFKQAGVLRASSVQELFDYSVVFASQPAIKGERIAIVTNAGGPSVMAVDAVERAGLRMAVLAEETKNKLRSFLPPAANVNNPVDALGDVAALPYGQALGTVASDAGVDALIAILTPQVVTQPLESARRVVEVARSCGKPVVACFMGGQRMKEAVDFLREERLPHYLFPENAVASLQALAFYRQRLEKTIKEEKIEWKRDKEKVEGILRNARNQGLYTLGDLEGREILSSYGIPVVSSVLTTSPRQCSQVAKEMGFPVVLKLVSPDILHKTEVGGVRLNITTARQAEESFRQMLEKVRSLHPDAKITGIQVQKQLEKAVELIIGVSKDAQFGHLLMFGLGGIFVEVMKDVTFRVIPVTRQEIKEMLGEIKAARLLTGFRNSPPVDLEACADMLWRVSALVEDFPEITELDINPLMAFPEGKGAVAVDVRLAITNEMKSKTEN